MTKELEEYQHHEERTLEKLALAVHSFQQKQNASGARFLLDGLRSWMGMRRDYGEAPTWFRRSKWEHEWTQIPESRLTETLNGYQEQGWQLVSAVIRHPNAVPEVMWVLIFKRSL